MNSLITWIVAVAMLLFGGHVPISQPGTQSAAAATPVPVQTATPIVAVLTASTSPSTLIDPTATLPQPIIEHVADFVATQPTDYVSTTTLALALLNLRTDLLTHIPASNNTQVTPQYVAANGYYATYNVAPISPAINNLSNVTVSNPSISGGSITNTTVAGYLPLSGGTVSGTTNLNTLNTSGTAALATTTVSGNLTVSGNIIGGIIAATSSVVDFNAINLVATNATTTNFFSTNASTTNATSTTFFTSFGHLASGVIDILSTSVANIVGITATNAT